MAALKIVPNAPQDACGSFCFWQTLKQCCSNPDPLFVPRAARSGAVVHLAIRRLDAKLPLRKALELNEKVIVLFHDSRVVNLVLEHRFE